MLELFYTFPLSLKVQENMGLASSGSCQGLIEPVLIPGDWLVADYVIKSPTLAVESQKTWSRRLPAKGW